jgi:hypothetical protein
MLGKCKKRIHLCVESSFVILVFLFSVVQSQAQTRYSALAGASIILSFWWAVYLLENTAAYSTLLNPEKQMVELLVLVLRLKMSLVSLAGSLK